MHYTALMDKDFMSAIYSHSSGKNVERERDKRNKMSTMETFGEGKWKFFEVLKLFFKFEIILYNPI